LSGNFNGRKRTNTYRYSSGEQYPELEEEEMAGPGPVIFKYSLKQANARS